jgi:hypothetical protein
MKTVVVNFGGTIDIGRAGIDDVELKFDDEGSTQRQCAAGEHALTWFVQAPPGSKYSIEISKPNEAKFKHEGTIDHTTRDAGVQWFQVGAK